MFVIELVACAAAVAQGLTQGQEAGLCDSSSQRSTDDGQHDDSEADCSA